MYKKYVFLIPLLVILSIVFLGFRMSSAQTTTAKELSIPNPLDMTDIFQLLDNIMGFLFLFSIPVAIIMLMYAGFMYMASAGNPKNIPNVSKIIQYTLIGFIIVLMAKGIVYVVKEVITGKSAGVTTSNNAPYPLNPNNGSATWGCNADGTCTEQIGGVFASEEACINFPCQVVNNGGSSSGLYQCIRSGATPTCQKNSFGIGTDLDTCQSICK